MINEVYENEELEEGILAADVRETLQKKRVVQEEEKNSRQEVNHDVSQNNSLEAIL